VEKLLSPAEVAEKLGVPVTTIYGWNHRRSGPTAIRVGRHVRFRPSEVERWLDDQSSTSPKR